MTDDKYLEDEPHINVDHLLKERKDNMVNIERCQLCNSLSVPYRNISGHICEGCNYEVNQRNKIRDNFDVDKEILSEKELIKLTLDNLAEAACCGFELTTDAGKSLAWMVDCAIKYGTVILNDDCPLSAAGDYTKYEEERVEKL